MYLDVYICKGMWPKYVYKSALPASDKVMNLPLQNFGYNLCQYFLTDGST